MNITEKFTSQEPGFWALLVGIDKYASENVRELRGCVNDVEAMRILLINRYKVPENHICVLTNEQATRSNILQQFESFLITNPRIKYGDQILFHYSGHGSQMPSRPQDYEPDGLNETIVPHDSRTPNVFDIPDKTLAALLDRLSDTKGDQITVILDSCHSGSATRVINLGSDSGSVGIRRVHADERVPPPDLDDDIQNNVKITTRSAGPSGWVTSDLRYVLLAGCRDREESNEYLVKINNMEIWHGALTFFTLEVLRELPVSSSYEELHERVLSLVNANYPTQRPQCEGDRQRQVFGNLQVYREPFIPVQKVTGNMVTFSAGFVHGLRPGTRLDIYPPYVRTRLDLPDTSLATVEVMEVTATTAQAQVFPGGTLPIPQHARGVITHQVYTGLRQIVALEAAPGEENEKAIESVRQAILTSGTDGSPYLEIVGPLAEWVDLRVKAASGKLSIYNGNYELLVQPEDIDGQGTTCQAEISQSANAVRKALESIVCYRTLINLRNEGQSELNGKVKLGLRHYIPGISPSPMEKEAIGPGGEITLDYDPQNKNSNLYVVDVINESDENIFINLFTLSPDYSITRLYPNRGQQEEIEPNDATHPFSIGPQKGTTPLRIWLPPGWDASQDYIKAIVTRQFTDLRLLEQKALSVPLPSPDRNRDLQAAKSQLEQLLTTVTSAPRTRFVGPAQTIDEDDWTVVELPLKTIRRSERVVLNEPQGRIKLSDELMLVKPEGFIGEVTVTTQGLATLGLEGDPGLKPPPGLERSSEIIQAIGRTDTRSIGEPGLVLTIDVNEASRQMISAENPLRLELPVTRGADHMELVPVIFDGEDYLVAGYGVDNGRSVEIVSLPSPVATPNDGGQPSRRGIGRTLRLFIYKKMGRHINDIGLRRAELKEGRVIYSDIQREQFQMGQRVAVLVHGLFSDSAWMVHQPAQFLQELGNYDHVLTWDYESFGTNIEDNGKHFALALKQQCGFGAEDGITVHVFAHSMGTLVTRCMIELFGGHEFIDRAVLAGPPNRGSTLATTGRGLVFLLTTLVNKATVVPIFGASNWALEQLYQQGVGTADLAVDSAILQKLNELVEPSNVPYLILAGENLPNEEERKRFNRIAQKMLDSTLDAIFGEQNDIAVGLSSMQGLRGGAYANLQTEVLSCDHFHYYLHPHGQQVIRHWLQG